MNDAIHLEVPEEMSPLGMVMVRFVMLTILVLGTLLVAGTFWFGSLDAFRAWAAGRSLHATTVKRAEAWEVSLRNLTTTSVEVVGVRLDCDCVVSSGEQRVSIKPNGVARWELQRAKSEAINNGPVNVYFVTDSSVDREFMVSLLSP